MAIKIIQKLIPKSKYNIKCPKAMEPVGVVIHNTANDATAQSEIYYMANNNKEVSFHFAVDDKEAIQAIPLDRNSWQAGDGSRGNGNRKHISIEICYSKSGGTKFEKAQNNAAELTAKLLKKYGWDISHVKKHEDFSGKHCPHRTLDDYGWDYFLNLVKGFLNPEVMSYTVRKGDSLWSISAQFLYDGKRYPELKALNGLTSDIVSPKQKIKIPVETKDGWRFYIVRRGDSLWSIAAKFYGDGKKFTELLADNRLVSSVVQPNQILRVKIKSTTNN